MSQSAHLLPAITTKEEYEALRIDKLLWPQAAVAICQRHGLGVDDLKRFGDGTDPADGSAVIFAIGKEHILKLFPPFARKAYNAELSVAELVFDKLPVETPEIYAHGLLDDWPYIIMSRLQGTYLVDIWNTLEQRERLPLVVQLAEVLTHLHALSADTLSLLEANWTAIISNRIEHCVERHREQGVSEYWLQQIPAYLVSAIPLYPTHFRPAIVSADIHQYHLLASQVSGQWRLSGLFDFDDALIGFQEYDLASAGLFMMSGNTELLHTFFKTYGYADSDINKALSRRLLAYTLLHRYRPFNWFSEAFTTRSYTTLEELAMGIYAFS